MLAAVLPLLTLTGCFDLYACGNVVLQGKLAPGGRTRALVYERDCGATTGVSLQVAVTESAGDPDRLQPIFVADDNDGAAPGGLAIVEMVWQDGGHLLVRHHPDARIFKADTKCGGARISYERQPL